MQDMIGFLKSFWLARREGSVAVSGGMVALMLVAAVGGAVDFTNAFDRRGELQRAADVAALAGASRTEMSIADIKAFARNNLRETEFFGTADISATREDGIVRVGIEAPSPTVLLGLIGMEGLRLDAESAAQFVPKGGKIEVALVLDTTQSMADDMDELRNAAQELVDRLFLAAGENVKISVVPYVASVNIGNGIDRMAWMDTAGTAPFHANSHEGMDVTNCNGYTGSGGCWQSCGCPGKPACGGGTDGANLLIGDGLKYAGSLLRSVLGAGSAQAAGSNPYPEPDPAVCPMKAPNEINHFELFDLLPNADWMGCVEARPPVVGGSVVNYDVNDVAPDPFNPATMFVPYFWLDEADWYGDDADNEWANDYIDDDAGPSFDPSVQYFPDWGDRHRNNVWKFDGTASATIVENDPDMSGPNRACPDPLLPLSGDRSTVESKVASLTHREGGGTVISEGLMWGWRTLSPGEPFTEGASYDELDTKKIIVLMSDGANSVIARSDDSGKPIDDTMGDYTAYGFGFEYDTGWARRDLIDSAADMATPYFEQVRAFLDTRTQQACTNVKNANPANPIEIYTLLVGESDASTVSLLENCATSVDMHYKEVSDINILGNAFEEVATGIVGTGGSRIVR